MQSADELLEQYIVEGQPYVLNQDYEDVADIEQNVRQRQEMGAVRRDSLAHQAYQRHLRQ